MWFLCSLGPQPSGPSQLTLLPFCNMPQDSLSSPLLKLPKQKKCNFLSVGPRESQLTSLTLHFLFCKMGIHTHLPYQLARPLLWSKCIRVRSPSRFLSGLKLGGFISDSLRDWKRGCLESQGQRSPGAQFNQHYYLTGKNHECLNTRTEVPSRNFLPEILTPPLCLGSLLISCKVHRPLSQSLMVKDWPGAALCRPPFLIK